ncbi:hypothetical protein SAMN06265375_1153 [Muriicola jejuensis]|uniref:Lipocalin-like domain-containing protein n=1 Tax=Muriicola jejuensis TaxID=504488 RepID=A0A6P0UEU7_9FLAO|nr:hypothetical protein [Muriicola jejuensis]NER11765.1 hypothetical protein [Muriicola jejuensis]SMP27620.1 hypothetical protein SAMN06265375_1153 [Muriicola jejuensis]
MYKGYILFLITILVSCKSNFKGNTYLQGNWKSGERNEVFPEYTEVYYSNSEIYYWTSFGLSSNKYKIEDGEYFLFDSSTNNFENTGRLIKLGKDRLTFRTDQKQVTFLRVEDQKTLEDFVTGKISEEEYIEAFEKRLIEW